jgi:signal transduction histidine kinase
MSTERPDLRESYIATLQEYLRAQSEKSLYEASLLSKLFVEQGIGPEEIVALHSESVDEASRDLPAMDRARVYSASFQFLLEIMITYGVRYKEYLDLKLTEATRAIQMQLEIDRFKAEESIRSQEQVIRGKEEFLAFVAHELRNPLTVIMGSINYMLRGAASGALERQQNLLGRARESTEQLLQLINDLLSLSQMEATEEPLNIQVVNADELIHTAVKNVAEAAAQKNIHIDIKPLHRTEKLFGDPEWLLRMLDNLLTNAIKFTADRGRSVGGDGENGPAVEDRCGRHRHRHSSRGYPSPIREVLPRTGGAESICRGNGVGTSTSQKNCRPARRGHYRKKQEWRGQRLQHTAAACGVRAI